MVNAVLAGSKRVNALRGICVVAVLLSGTVVALMEAPEPEEGAWPAEERT